MQDSIKQGNWALHYKDDVERHDEKAGQEVREGDDIVDFRGTPDVITGGTPPHKPSSTGRVTVASGGEFYPSVFGLRWVWLGETDPWGSVFVKADVVEV